MEHRAETYDEEEDDGKRDPGGKPPLFATAAPLAIAETAVSAVAAQARAMVEARFLVAIHRPRDLDRTRVKLMQECRRPGFAEVARYRRPAGREQNTRGEWVEKIIEGPSIRFAEAAMRHMGNLDVQSPTIYDDDDKRIVRVSVTDLETNATFSRDIVIDKIAEQKKLRKNQKPIGTRTNSYGDLVYLVRANEGQVELKQAAAISKAIRTLGLRLLPGDIQDECMQLCIATRDAKIKEDPDGARKRMIDGFAELGIAPDELKWYAGQELSSLSPAQIGDLRDLYLAIKDGITTWRDVKRARAEADDEDGVDAGKGLLDELKEKTSAHAAKVKAEKADKAATPAAEPKSEKAAPIGGAKQESLVK